MNMKVACGLTAVALSPLLGTPAFAADDVELEEAPISVVGCIQRETDYRRLNDSGKGGFLGFGGGLGDEYVLVNASRSADGAFGDCAAAAGGEAYELTGSGEEHLEAFVGQRVAIAGVRKEAEIDSATGRPTGGRQAGDDLRLFEVEVSSFRPLAAPVPVATVARAQQEPPPIEADRPRADDADRVAAPPVRRQDVEEPVEQLPRTASPLALTGLAGLLSLAGAAASRHIRRRPRRL